MVARGFFIVAAFLFFMAAVGAERIIPNPTAWGFVATAIGLLVGGWSPWPRKGP